LGERLLTGVAQAGMGECRGWERMRSSAVR
jgi:hypothetical protein